MKDCKKIDAWNAYHCNEYFLSQLVFTNHDKNSDSVALQPVYVQKTNSRINNKINAFMDHCWEGFYTCQKRTGRFNSIVDASPGSAYDVLFTGNPGERMGFHLKSHEPKAGMTIRIHYPSAVSRMVIV